MLINVKKLVCRQFFFVSGFLIFEMDVLKKLLHFVLIHISVFCVCCLSGIFLYFITGFARSRRTARHEILCWPDA